MRARAVFAAAALAVASVLSIAGPVASASASTAHPAGDVWNGPKAHLTGDVWSGPKAAKPADLPTWFNWGSTSDHHGGKSCIIAWGGPMQSAQQTEICGDGYANPVSSSPGNLLGDVWLNGHAPVILAGDRWNGPQTATPDGDVWSGPKMWYGPVKTTAKTTPQATPQTCTFRVYPLTAYPNQGGGVSGYIDEDSCNRVEETIAWCYHNGDVPYYSQQGSTYGTQLGVVCPNGYQLVAAGCRVKYQNGNWSPNYASWFSGDGSPNPSYCSSNDQTF